MATIEPAWGSTVSPLDEQHRKPAPDIEKDPAVVDGEPGEGVRRTTLRKLALVLAAYAAYSAMVPLILRETALGAFLARRLPFSFVLLGPPALLTFLPADGTVALYIIGTGFLMPLAYGLVVAKEETTRGLLFAGLVLGWLFGGSCAAGALI